ncbi:vitamin K-dependent protein C-like isoform X2 [Colossoma macropomum]|uniref:vitamin K-dependent protein C-like isoform X2 n=1 Tax=Colossoma macropomum TaxID=42526 RepID=UPI0018640BF1|nr:vitamin K-dependent protein C-like isoform X2 [Colossoma macropomum]
MAGRPFLVLLLFLWTATALSMSVFYSSPKAHMLLRTKRANSFLEEIKPPSLERECVEERCDFEEAREIFQTRESTLEFWTRYVETTSFNCSVNNGDCNQDCIERKDKTGRFCSCIPGYQLHENAKNCTPKNQDSCGQILIAKSAYSTKPRPILQPWLVGGEVGKKGESPWQALILNAKGKFHCGGVLIDESWILTAAHCLETSLRFSVRLGDYLRFKKEDSEVTIPVSKIVSHPKYNPVTVDNDIALLRLATRVKFTNYILPACLPSRSLAERVLHLNGTQTVVTGWGKQNETASHYSSALGFIHIPLVDHDECTRHMVNNLTQNVLCAGIIGKVRDACEGDSGGPMMTQYHNTWFLIGLVSWGEGCGRTDKLGIYTKVSNYLEWIDSVRKEATSP